MYGYIYKTTNHTNGTIYIGQHHGEFDSQYLGSGVAIIKAIKKYGRNSFSVCMIQEAFDKGDLDCKEVSAIAIYRLTEIRMYNIWDGGLGKPSGWKNTPQSIEKMRLAKLGKKASKETKKKMSISQSKRPPPSNETRKRLAESWRIRREAFELAKKENPSLTIHDFRTTNRRGEKNV